ncbi:hypothetical protein ADU37_CDS12980 [Thermococcus sp. 2319x1]|nr:hypothetical protein ADU37_CDS12980 [Thermococcus sp. 2319x1]
MFSGIAYWKDAEKTQLSLKLNEDLDRLFLLFPTNFNASFGDDTVFMRIISVP